MGNQQRRTESKGSDELAQRIIEATTLVGLVAGVGIIAFIAWDTYRRNQTALAGMVFVAGPASDPAPHHPYRNDAGGSASIIDIQDRPVGVEVDQDNEETQQNN